MTFPSDIKGCMPKKVCPGEEIYPQEVFPWLSRSVRIEQLAILVTSSRKELAGCGSRSLPTTGPMRWPSRGGANILFGPDPTFFGQLENNSNAFFRVRYSF